MPGPTAAATTPRQAPRPHTTTNGDKAGVRPSSGAATFAESGALERSSGLGGAETAAPEDGRTPVARPTRALTRPRLPAWLRTSLPTTDSFAHTRALLDELRLHTVCQSAACPNHWECWSKGTATFMIGGDRCTRACAFCAVTTAKPFALDADEPARVAEATGRLQLRHVVITGVARDDLADGGADHFRRTIEAVRASSPGTVIEVLTPDFNAREAAIETVLAARPHIFNHNLETVRRLTPVVRSRATYDRSLSVLQHVKAKAGATTYTKSGLMLGLGETENELFTALADLRRVGCDLLTLGQYLQPTLKHLPVVEFITPEKFAEHGARARAMGFRHVASAPMVRSSYHADEFSLPASS
jgi:lipoyl synthase